MHPANHDLAAQVREQGIRQSVQQSPSQAPSSQVPRVRSLQSEESWIDVSSRNSSSSLSSAAGEDTLTPGQGLGSTAFSRRGRLQRTHSGQTRQSTITHTTATTDLSQEEYDESESEQEQVMTSSNEDLQYGNPSGTVQMSRPVRRFPQPVTSDAHSMNSSADETTLNVGRASESRLAASFRPQPNAFTHPPISRHANSYQPEPTSYLSANPTHPMARASSANATFPQLQSQTSAPGPRTLHTNPSVPTRPRTHTPYNMISPSHNVSVDHDAALRASLSTLLSCAAARRGAPKRETPSAPLATAPGQQITQGTLCLIPESELDNESRPAAMQSQAEERSRHPVATRQRDTVPTRQKSPRRKSKSKSPSRSPHRRKLRAIHTTTAASSNTADLDSSSVSPTTLWFLGVGALFLGGAVLFTAGYIQGREVGYVEGFSDASVAACRNEATADGLRGMGRRGWRSATTGASIWGVS